MRDRLSCLKLYRDSLSSKASGFGFRVVDNARAFLVVFRQCPSLFPPVLFRPPSPSFVCHYLRPKVVAARRLSFPLFASPVSGGSLCLRLAFFPRAPSVPCPCLVLVRARPAQGARVRGGCSLSPLRFRVPRALARRSRLLGALASGELGQLCSVFLFRCQLDQLAFNRWFSLLKRLRAPVPPRLLMLVPRASYLFSDHNLYFSSSSNFPLSPTLYASGFPSG